MRFLISALVLFYAASLAFGGDTSAPQKPAIKEPKTYHITVPGLLQIALAIEKTEYRLGEPIIVTKRVTNISGASQLVDEASLSEGFSLQQLDSSTICGVLSDHAHGYQARVVPVANGSSLTSTYDFSGHPCFRGVGFYQVSVSYCQYDSEAVEHGVASPSWCLRSEPVMIRVVQN